MGKFFLDNNCICTDQAQILTGQDRKWVEQKGLHIEGSQNGVYD